MLGIAVTCESADDSRTIVSAVTYTSETQLYLFDESKMSGIQPCQVCRFATACVARKMRVRRRKIDHLVGKKGDKSLGIDNECVNGKERQNYE
jgi:hypothetical protein